MGVLDHLGAGSIGRTLDPQDREVGGLHGEDRRVLALDPVHIDSRAFEELGCRDVEQRHIAPSVSRPFGQRDRHPAFELGVRRSSRVDRGIERGHVRIVEACREAVDAGLKGGDVGLHRHEGSIDVGDPHDELSVRQVARRRRVLGGGRRHDDGDGDPQGEADRGEGGTGAGLITAEVAQRQAWRDREP